ncbi:MAG TPA: MopE-related protein [Polyangia bacterium]|nr:MopE-related protein [Polyangia bacterium]
MRASKFIRGWTWWPPLAVLLAAARPAAAQEAGAAPPCGTGADYEPVETRCDGVDNDCDGLVDVLLPTAANACAPADGLSCAPGHAACVDGQRVCLAPGPSPEVVDGADNDCDGVVDDVPAAPLPAARARALLLVPGYAFTDAALEVDHIASVLDQWGIAFDRPSAPAEFDAALAGLSRYPLVVIPGYLEEDFLVPFRQAALEGYVHQGGVLVVFKPIFADGSPAQQLIGALSTARRSDADAVAFAGPRAGALRAFDSPEELRVPIATPGSEEAVVVHVLAPAGPETQVLATASTAGVPIGAVLTRRGAGAGAVYAAGYDLHTSVAQRCYINCFEPAGDLAGLFLREVFREAMRGHVVLKHTVPGPEDGLAIFSHDLCAYDAQQPGDGWGEPGALQIAAAEQRWGARGSFFATTQNVATDESVPYYSPPLMQQLCGLDMCPVGAHSVVHPADFGQLPPGTCAETAGDYAAAVDPTVCGEVGVSLELVAQATGARPVAWRSPYLDVNPFQYDALAARGVLLDSSYAIGDLKSNLPVSLAHTGVNQFLFHAQPLYSMPIALEDGIGGIEDGSPTRQEMNAANAAQFTSLWSYALLRNADNGGHTMALMHPSYGVRQPQDNVRSKVAVLENVLQAARARGLRVQSTAADVAAFWQARDEAVVDASYLAGAPARYAGTITTGAHDAPELTVEFGDAISAFDCAGCGVAQIAGKRVTLHGALPASTTFAFQATVGAVVAAPPAVPAATRGWALVVAAGLLASVLRGRRRRVSGIVAAAILLHALPCQAQETTPYCTRIRERAAGDAALLVAPRLLVQGLRFPDNGTLEGGVVVANGFQLRAGVAFSATDLYKGLGLQQIADADCRAHDARVRLESTVSGGDAAARQAALEAQVAFLEAHAAEARQAVDRATARFTAHAITLIELEDVRRRAATLERMAVQSRGQAAQLAAKTGARTADPHAGQRAAEQLARTYAEASADLDRATANVQSAQPWQLEVTAGVIPSSRFDWYGILQLGFNLGGVVQARHAAAWARAHQQEVAGAPYEPASLLAQQRQQLSAARDQARLELGLVDRELEVVVSTAQALEGADAAAAVHQRDRLALDQLALGAQRAFQDAYLTGLQRLLEND